MPGPVPERWAEYLPLGKAIAGTRFIAFKVPLEKGICNKLNAGIAWFTPQDLVTLTTTAGHQLGLVIDLTFTKRYYKPAELLQQGVAYGKIGTAGQAVPSTDVQKRFIQEVDQFLELNADNNKLIGVHCTHGINRTGYLVCRYMINRLNFDPEDAIKAFNVARGYCIERENYLQDLRLGKTSLEARSAAVPTHVPNDGLHGQRVHGQFDRQHGAYGQYQTSYANHMSEVQPALSYNSSAAQRGHSATYYDYSQPYNHRGNFWPSSGNHRVHDDHSWRSNTRKPSDNREGQSYSGRTNEQSWSSAHHSYQPYNGSAETDEIYLSGDGGMYVYSDRSKPYGYDRGAASNGSRETRKKPETLQSTRGRGYNAQRFIRQSHSSSGYH